MLDLLTTNALWTQPCCADPMLMLTLLLPLHCSGADRAGRGSPPRSDSAGDLHTEAAQPGTSPGDQNLAATLQALAKQTKSLHKDTRAPQDSGNMLDPGQLTR